MLGSAGCIDLLAEVEARLDFDEDLPPLDAADVRARIASLQQDIEDALRTAKQSRLLRNGLQASHWLFCLHIWIVTFELPQVYMLSPCGAAWRACSRARRRLAHAAKQSRWLRNGWQASVLVHAYKSS